MQVHVASINPQKIQATKNAIANSTVLGYRIDSDVSDQPIGLNEIFAGVVNRLNNLQKLLKTEKIDTNFTVSFENGLVQVGNVWVDMAIVGIQNFQTGETQFSTSAGVAVPYNPENHARYETVLFKRAEKDVCAFHTGGVVNRVKNLTDALQIAYCALINDNSD